MKYINFRPAVAMIELIFSLVIMGIVLLSAPMLISQATKSSFLAFQQESISIVSAHANALMTYAWDEQNTLSQVNFVNAVLQVNSNADSELNATSRLQPGKRKFNVANPLAVATLTLGTDPIGVNEAYDDIDDFTDSNQSLTLAATGSVAVNEGDYIDQNITLSTNVRYMEDNAAYATVSGAIVFNIPKTFVATTTNIKYFTVRLTSNATSEELNEKEIALHAFVCNIGAAQPQSSENMSSGQLVNAPIGRY
ncbi:MAG: hypothetical protein COA92_04015 [Sulfurovum sp.]|nr:MAG: hypothetical protein COA92_04015 [Sulfurovum sp.]